jgi:hypothetical protein
MKPVRTLDLSCVKELKSGDTFVDLRNVYEPVSMVQEGLACHCVGRPVSG